MEELRCINTLRCLSIDMVQKANSGHPGMPLGMAPAMHVLYSRILKFSSKHPDILHCYLISLVGSCFIVGSLLNLLQVCTC